MCKRNHFGVEVDLVEPHKARRKLAESIEKEVEETGMLAEWGAS